MSEVIAQINTAPSGDTWDIAIGKMNQSLNAISTMVVSVNSHANGGLTTGNGYVAGVFGARDLVANTLSGGTVETPGILTISSNVAVSGDTLEVGDIIVNSSDISINGVSITQIAGLIKFTNTTIGTTDQEISSFDKLAFRGAEYIVTVKDTNANGHQISKALVLHDSGNAYCTEFGIMYSNTILGQLSANANATFVRVYLTPTVANTTVSGSIILVDI